MEAPPDIRQRYSFDCGPACAEVVASWFGKRKPEVRCSRRYGASADAMAEGFNAVGLLTQFGTMTTLDLLHHLRIGRVLIPILSADQPDEGHYVVVWRIRGERVRLHDPDTGPRVDPLNTFLRKWKRRGNFALAVGTE